MEKVKMLAEAHGCSEASLARISSMIECKEPVNRTNCYFHKKRLHQLRMQKLSIEKQAELDSIKELFATSDQVITELKKMVQICEDVCQYVDEHNHKMSTKMIKSDIDAVVMTRDAAQAFKRFLKLLPKLQNEQYLGVDIEGLSEKCDDFLQHLLSLRRHHAMNYLKLNALVDHLKALIDEDKNRTEKSNRTGQSKQLSEVSLLETFNKDQVVASSPNL